MTKTELQARRERLGLTQAQLAELLGVTSNTVARWERGTLNTRHLTILGLALDCLEYRSDVRKEGA